MVDSPDHLFTICLHKIASVLKHDENKWKKQVERCIEQIYQLEEAQLSISDQRKRKYHQTDDDVVVPKVDYNAYEVQFDSLKQSLFLEQFLHGLCPLNSILSERLADYLVRHDQLNDFTLAFFSSDRTCLRRIILNVQYISLLQCHILRQHASLVELKIIFKDLNIYRLNHKVNELFYQLICPPLHSKFHDIYTVYGPLVLHHLQRQTRTESTRLSLSNRYLYQRSPTLLDGFSHQRIFNTILNNLNPLTFERLERLDITHYKFFAAELSTILQQYSHCETSPLIKGSGMQISTMVNTLPTNLRLIFKFINLTSLNISGTDINNHALVCIVDAFDKLNTLDISLCSSLTSFCALSKLSTKLKYLNLYNSPFQMQENPTIYQILYQMTLLEHLDISIDNCNGTNNNQHSINTFLSDQNCLPNLKYLDISGQKNIMSSSIQSFLKSHPKLLFLGIFLTKEKYLNCLFNKYDSCYSTIRHYTCDIDDLLLSAINQNDIHDYEPYLIESLKRYYKRTYYVQKILYYIFFLTRLYQSTKQNLLIDLILHTMTIHRNLHSVQMASTACIYNLTRTQFVDKINLKCLANIVQSIITVMEIFPHQQQLQKNCLLTLCSDRILHEPNFNFSLLASLVMNNLQNYTDQAIIQSGVAVLALLTTRLSVEECTQLGSLINLKCLLQLIEHQVVRLQNIESHQNPQQSNNNQQLTSDDTLRFCLSLLWNLTDENPLVCERFIQSKGLDSFQRLIRLFASDTILLTKILGLLSNISEVPCLINHLYSIDIVSLIRKFLTGGIIDVAFSAAGILAHILFKQIDHQLDTELCQYMRNAIIKWENPEKSIITYRSFKSFMPLLNCTQVPVIQLWALWAIHHVCSTDRARYIRIIREEKLYDLIQKLYINEISSDLCDTYVVRLLSSILHILKPCL